MTPRLPAVLLGLAGLLLLPIAEAGAAELRILARTGTLSPSLLSRFERETATSVLVEDVDNDETMEWRLEQMPSGVDIAFPSDHLAARLIEHGLLERVWADRLPGFWNIEDPWRSRSFDPRNEFTIPHQWGTIAFAVDTSVHRGDIDSLRLLFAPPPELVGKIGLMDAPEMVELALLYQGDARCTVDPARLSRAGGLLRTLLAGATALPQASIVQALEVPGLALAVTRSGDAMRARERRPSLAYAYPREGNLVWTDVIAVPRDPPDRTNALKFLTFMLRPENAALQSNHNGSATMIRGTEGHMEARVLAAPELVAPWPAKVSFLVSCGADVTEEHARQWSRIKAAAAAAGAKKP